MSIQSLETSIENLENSITNLLNANLDGKVTKIIDRLVTIHTELKSLKNSKLGNFDRQSELKSLLDTALNREGLGYNSALQIFKESNINTLLSYQFDNGFYALSNGERIGIDFRIIMHHYLNCPII